MPASLKKIALKYSALLFAGLGLLCAGAAWADAPVPKGLNLQPPGSVLQTHINDFHNLLLWIISIISIFVLGLLIYVMVRYNKWTNPNPTTTAHNVKLEIVWTLIPCFILIGISLVSFPLIYYGDRIPEKIDVTLKVTSHQWYWSYEYPDHGNISFDSHAIWDSSNVTQADAEKLIADFSKGWLIKGEPRRLLEVDNRVVLPVGANVRVQIAADDVEHSWFIPSLGINRMSVPGHLNEVWLKLEREGIFYGQCSMICGNGHAFMPIVIEGVSPEKFEAWVKSKKATAGLNGVSPQFAAMQ